MRAEQHIGDMRQKELALRISTLEACDPDKLFCDEIQALVQEAISELASYKQGGVYFEPDEKFTEQGNCFAAWIFSVKTVEFHITRSLKQFTGAAEGLSVSLEFFIKQDHASVIWTWSCSYFIYRNQKL